MPFIRLVAAAAILAFAAATPAHAADLQLAQGKANKVMSGEKGADSARDALMRNQERAKGKENAMERGEGKKSGLHKQMEDEAEKGHGKKAK